MKSRPPGALMTPIGAFYATCRELTSEQFRRQRWAPFLVHSSLVQGPLKTFDPRRGKTLDELVVDDAPTAPPRSDSPRSALTVFTAKESQAPSKSLSVGCGPSCEIRIEAASISRVHAVIHDKDGAYSLEDGGSAGGTWLNGELVEGPARRRLVSADRVSFGGIDLLFLPPRDFYALVRSLEGLGF